MKTLATIVTAAAALLADPAAQARFTGPVPSSRAPNVPGDCTITIAFSSYGAGIDRPTLVNVERLLNSDRGVRSVTRHAWGREGEVSLCARTRSLAEAFRLARRIRAMLPARPRGPIQVNTLRSHRS